MLVPTSLSPSLKDGANILRADMVVAAVSSASVQEAIVNTSHVFLTNGLNDEPFGTRYYVEGPNVGEWIANEARPTVGSNFAIVALHDGLIYTG